MCPFVGVVVGVGAGSRPQVPRHHLGPYRAEIQTKRQQFSHQASTKEAVTEFRTPGVQSDRNSALQASGTPEKPKIRNQQHNPQVYPPYTPSQCYPKYAFTALATTAPEYMGCYGPASAEHRVDFSWRDICRRSHMGAQLNPTSIALIAALDYLLATKMDVAENRAHTAVLPSVAYHGGGGYRPQDSLSAQRHTKEGSGGGVLFTYTLHLAIGLTTAHSGQPLAPKTVAWAVLAGACCGGTQ